MASTDGSSYWFNHRWYEYTGTTPEQMEGWGWQSVVDPEILPKVLERWRASIATGAPFEMVFPLRAGDGAFRPFLTRVVPLQDCDGHVTGWVGTNTDISEQSKALEALAASERLYRAIGESIDYGVWVCDPDGRNTYASESFLKLVGLTQEQCSNFGWGTVLHPDDAERTIAAWKDCVRTEGEWSVEHRFLGVDGEWRPILARGVPVRDEQGRIICWAGINLDISALKRAEEETRRANALLEAFFSASPAILNIEDEEFRYLKTDPLTASYFGLSRDEIVGRRLPDLAPDFIREFGPMFREVLETGRPRLNTEVWAGIPDRDMDVRHWLASYFAVPLPEGKRGLGVVGIDITENKRAEERLRQAQKLESLGRLAGGLAHDFNNLMNVVIIYADSALDELRAGESATHSVTEIRNAAEKAVEMGRQLMAFSSSKQEIQPEMLNLNPVVGNSEKILRRLIGVDVKISFQPAAGLRSVKADRGQMTQILMNLAVNARDAMPDGGTFVIKTENVDLDAADLRLDPGASPGAYVLLTVRDTGIGMDKDTQTRIFEPFFTTKEVGKGTGLGLWVVYEIVRQYGGFITVASEPGRGTEFNIYLPAVPEAPEPVRDTQAPRAAGGSETILLVEDEAALRNKIQEILGTAGYDVLAAPNGYQGFRLPLSDTRPIHLLLTDVVMPEMSGTQLAKRLRDLRPETKVLFVSGFPDKQSRDVDPEATGHFLAKPFNREKLLRRVREVLDGVRAADVTGTEPMSASSA
jgi:PAS domain S-box-containing protein